MTALLYLDQVLFTVYVLRVRDGDPAFIARYLPGGWFTLARGDAIEALARLFPAPGLLAPSVLRVPAFLELPFVVFAYLTVCRWFSPGVYRRALRPAWPVAISYTVTFGLIEWSLHNPYTPDDLVIRGAPRCAWRVWTATLRTMRMICLVCSCSPPRRWRLARRLTDRIGESGALRSRTS